MCLPRRGNLSSGSHHTSRDLQPEHNHPWVVNLKCINVSKREKQQSPCTSRASKWGQRSHYQSQSCCGSTNTTCNTIDITKDQHPQNPWYARIISLLVCVISLPTRALRVHAWHLPAHASPMLASAFLFACLPCLFSLHTVDIGILLCIDILLVRVFQEATMH